MAVATLEELEAELIELVKEVEAFNDKGYSIFNIDDFDSMMQGGTRDLPIAGIGFDGSEPNKGNQVTPTDGGNAASLLNVQFIIVIAIPYKYTGQDGGKDSAFQLLHQVRQKVYGYKKANTRPWRFMGERPEPALSGDGVVFYIQVWQTTLPLVGTVN